MPCERTGMRCLFSPEQIADRIGQVADEINRDYAGKEVLVVCVLKGAFMFFSDLVRRLDVGPEIDFVRVASYGKNTQSSMDIRFTKDIELSLEGKHVLLVEDVIDSGYTIDFLMRQFAVRGAVSLRTAALIDKRERREFSVHIDYAGFVVQTGFIVGYGLDFAERYRELPGIFLLNQA